MFSARNLWVAVGCAALLSAAHADGSDPTPSARKAKSTAHWTHAMSKHNGSGIRLSYSVPTAMQPGRTGSVELQFSGVTADDARVEWHAPPGSVVTSTLAGSASSLALPAGQVTTVSLDVTPAADGRIYLDVFTSQGGRTSAQSVPLKVGTGLVQLKREGTSQTTASGEKVISLPSTPK